MNSRNTDGPRETTKAVLQGRFFSCAHPFTRFRAIVTFRIPAKPLFLLVFEDESEYIYVVFTILVPAQKKCCLVWRHTLFF